MPATSRREWIARRERTWRSLTDPYAAESYEGSTPAIERINDGRRDHGLEPQPELVLALVWRAVEELPERHSRVTLERSDTGERKPWQSAGVAPIARHQPAVDALCWTWRDGDAPQNYAPILADRDMPVRDLALFVHKIAHTDRLRTTADKTAILSNLFESYSRPTRTAGTIWMDTTIGAMACTVSCPTPTIPRGSPNVSPPTCRSANGSGASPATRPTCAGRRHTTPTARRRRTIDARRRLPGVPRTPRGTAPDNGGNCRSTPRPRARRPADAERLEHVADLLERVQPTPLEAEQIKAPLGAPWIPARDVHDFMMETFNVRGHGLTPGKLSQYSVDWIPQLGQWRVGYSGGGDIDYKAARTYGTEDRNPFQLLEACLDNAQITVTKDSPTETTASGKPKRVKDQKATMAAIEKANAIRDTWTSGCSGTPTAREGSPLCTTAGSTA